MPKATMVAYAATATQQKTDDGTPMKRFHILDLFIILCALLMAACQPMAPAKQEITLSPSGSVLSIYVNFTSAPDFRLELKDIELNTKQTWLTCKAPQVKQERSSRQRLVAIDSLPATAYEKIRFRVELYSEEDVLLRTEQVELAITNHLILKESGSTCLFIQCALSPYNLDRSLPTLFNVDTQEPPLADNLLYVLCPDLATLYIVRTDQFIVTAAYPLQGKITDMVVDNQQRLVYFLDRQRQQIQRWDGISQQMTDRIPLPMTQGPEGLAISDDGKDLFVTDTVNRQLLKIDAETGTRLAQINIGHEPSRPYWYKHNGQPRLAVISQGDQQLHILNADNLATIADVTAGQRPYETIYANETLFISDVFDHQVIQLNPDNGTIQARIPTAGSPTAMIDDEINRNLIIAQQSRNNLALLPYGQQLIARQVEAGHSPQDLAMSHKRRLLYIADKNTHSIYVLDLPSEKVIQIIEIGSVPDVIVVQEP
jgi:sugar lactone lactonase YvrE